MNQLLDKYWHLFSYLMGGRGGGILSLRERKRKKRVRREGWERARHWTFKDRQGVHPSCHLSINCPSAAGGVFLYMCWGVFLAEGRRRVRSRQVELLCGWSSWQLPVNPVGFVFFSEPHCSEAVIYMWSVASCWHMPGCKQPAVTCHCMQTPAERPAGQ